MAYINNKNVITITITGIDAYYIERANRASFYGINGNANDCAAGRRAAERAVKAYLADNGINWNSYDILKARTIDTTGTKTPYKAEIDARIDVA